MNPKNPTFVGDLQEANEEIEVDIARKKQNFNPQTEVPEVPKVKEVIKADFKKEKSEPSEKSFNQDLITKAEEIAKEERKLEEIQNNLSKNQRMVAERIKELSSLQERISKVLEGKKEIDEDLKKMNEKKTIFFSLETL